MLMVTDWPTLISQPKSRGTQWLKLNSIGLSMSKPTKYTALVWSWTKWVGTQWEFAPDELIAKAAFSHFVWVNPRILCEMALLGQLYSQNKHFKPYHKSDFGHVVQAWPVIHGHLWEVWTRRFFPSKSHLFGLWWGFPSKTQSVSNG